MRRLVSWIRAQESAAVGVYGLSLGGYNAALLAAFDPDLRCAIAGVPATEFVELGRLHSRLAARRAEAAGIDWDEVTRLYRVISPLALTPRIPRDRRYIFGGRADRIVPPAQVTSLWQRWGCARITWYEGTHLSCPFEPTVREFVGGALMATLLRSAADGVAKPRFT
jgi:pimeloyl-ACP methyl ester carboxylesterase